MVSIKSSPLGSSDVDPEDQVFVGRLVVRTPIPDDEKFSTIHVVAYILAAVTGREYSGWQPALVHGFGFFMLMQLLSALSCICYYLCMSEIWSAIPFSGGGYGLTRASMGFYWGFLDGVAEAVLYSAQTALSAMGLGMKFVVMFQLPSHTLLAFCAGFYILAVYLTAQKSLKVLRRAYMVLAGISLAILFAYLCGMLKYVDFAHNASLHNNTSDPSARVNWFTGTMNDFMFLLPYSLLPYAGVKSFGLLTLQTKAPKVTLPRAVILGFCLIFAMNMFAVFVFASQPPGILKTAHSGSPMAYGNMLMFQLKRLDNSKLTTWLSIPAGFAKLLTFILPGGNLLHCLGNSYHLPPVLCLNKTKDRTNGCIVCAAAGMLLVVIIHFNPFIDIYNVIILITALTSLTFIYSYVQLKTTYSNVQRSFINPWGLWGAAYTFLSFCLVAVSTAVYQQDNWFNLKFVAGLCAVVTVYYFSSARRGDCLCEEEDQIFLALHVRNFNVKKKAQYKSRSSKRVPAGFKSGRIVPSGVGNSSSSSSCKGGSNQGSSKNIDNLKSCGDPTCAGAAERRSFRIVEETDEEAKTPEKGGESRSRKPTPKRSQREADDISIRLTADGRAGEELGGEGSEGGGVDHRRDRVVNVASDTPVEEEELELFHRVEEESPESRKVRKEGEWCLLIARSDCQ